jgi:hypothetical protein
MNKIIESDVVVVFIDCIFSPSRTYLTWMLGCFSRPAVAPAPPPHAGFPIGQVSLAHHRGINISLWVIAVAEKEGLLFIRFQRS